MQYVPKTGPFLIAANHQSNFDPIFVGTVAYERVFASIARESLFKSKILAWFMRSFGVIAIRRGESDTKAIRAALQVLQSGQGVLIFPEGTRSKDGKIGEFQRGFWLLLKKSKVPVLPLGIEGAFDAYPIGSNPKLFGCIESRAGELIPAEQLLEMGEEVGTIFLKDKIESLMMDCRKSIDARSK